SSENPAKRTAQANARQLERHSERDLSRLADQVPRAADDFLAASANISPTASFPTPTGLSLTVPTMTPTLLGEVVVHGFDIARAAGVRWEISRADALTVISGILALVPHYVHRRRAARSEE